MAQRGEVVYLDRYKQLINFSGLRWGNITPTDIDMCIDFQGKCLIFGEFKYGNAPFPQGQKIALEVLCDKSNVPAIALIARHHVPPNEFINVSKLAVSEFYWNKKWMKDRKNRNVYELIHAFRSKAIEGKLK